MYTWCEYVIFSFDHFGSHFWHSLFVITDGRTTIHIGKWILDFRSLASWLLRVCLLGFYRTRLDGCKVYNCGRTLSKITWVESRMFLHNDPGPVQEYPARGIGSIGPRDPIGV